MPSARRTTVAAALLVGALAGGCGTGSPDASPPPGSSARPVASGAAPDPAPSVTAAPSGRLRLPPRARSPREVADQVLAAERTIGRPGASAHDVAAAGRLQQVAYRVLGEHPRWDARVFELLPRWAWRIAAPNLASRRAFRSMHGELSRTVPAWRIVRPRPPAELLRHYRAAERRFGVDWEYLAAINLVETGMGRIRGLSVAGAQGPMQFMPSTWAAYGRGDVDDPRDAILAAGRYLRAMGFRSGSARAVDQALYRYNNHPAYVLGVRRLAEVMQRRPRAYLGYHAWEVQYLTFLGDVHLPVGYLEREPVPVREYLRRRDG